MKKCSQCTNTEDDMPIFTVLGRQDFICLRCAGIEDYIQFNRENEIDPVGAEYEE